MAEQGTSCPDYFVQELIACQSRLRAYALALLANPDQADEVVQESNLVLCHKVEEFQRGTDFASWACRVVYFQCLAHRQKLGRERLIFDDELLGELADQAEQHSQEIDHRRNALRMCLEELSVRHRELVQQRYANGGSVQLLAEQLGRPASSVSQALWRIRNTLLDCVQRRLSRPLTDA